MVSQLILKEGDLPPTVFSFASGPQLQPRQRGTILTLCCAFWLHCAPMTCHLKTLRVEGSISTFFEHYFRLMSDRLPFFLFLFIVYHSIFLWAFLFFFFFNNLEMRPGNLPWLWIKKNFYRNPCCFSCWKQVKANAFRLVGVFFLHWKLKSRKF